jgi:hypothetical protein
MGKVSDLQSSPQLADLPTAKGIRQECQNVVDAE